MALLRVSGGVSFSGGISLPRPDYVIENSIRGNRWTTQYLDNTFSSGVNRKTWSVSFWVQRSSLEYEQQVVYSHVNSSNGSGLSFYSNKQLRFVHVPGSLQINNYVDLELSDANGWYHILFVYDTTQAFRYKAYINGVEGTWTSDPTLLSANYETFFNGAYLHRWFQNPNSGSVAAGAYTDIHFLDGIAADVNEFGHFDDNGVWQPHEYDGSHGTNGYHLLFNDVTDLGKDSSSNGNDHTATGYSTLGNDFWQLPTSPTINNKNNAAKHDAAQTYAYAFLSRGGYSMNSNVGSSWRSAWSTIGFEGVNSGKWYWECKRTDYSTRTSNIVGLASPEYHAHSYYPGQINNSIGLQPYTATDARLYQGGSFTTLSGFGDFQEGDVIMVAFDADNGDIWFGNNGTWYNSGDPATGTNPTETGLPSEMIPVNGSYNSNNRVDLVSHLDELSYDIPTGFKPLVHSSLINQNVFDGEEHFQAVTYTGTGTSQSIGGLKFSPDLVWIKNRDDVNWHVLFDTTRGATNYISSNESAIEATDAQTLTSFDSGGFSVGTNTGVNDSGEDYVAWCWKAGAGGISNTDGTITSNVNVNTAAGFSIVTYTGNSTGGSTIGHGLGAVPAMIIIKNRDNTTDWVVYHRWMDETSPQNYFMKLNGTNAATALSTVWNNTAPTSSVFTVGNDGALNNNGHGYIAYIWTDIPGYSKFGRYTGLGDAAAGAGIHTNTGFKPAFFMTKSESNAPTSWVMHDNARDVVNTGDKALFANLNNAEQTTWYHEFVSNGVKINHANVNANGSGRKYVYAAFGKTPQRIARGGRK